MVDAFGGELSYSFGQQRRRRPYLEGTTRYVALAENPAARHLQFCDGCTASATKLPPN